MRRARWGRPIRPTRTGQPVPHLSNAPDTGPRAADIYRAGFVSFVGRPNVGKSTLTNALVGEKVAITSSKPQTTRRAIRGIVSRDHGQLIIVDTPGMNRPRTLLGERLNALVQSTLSDVDIIALCVPAIVTKTDAAPKARVAHQLLAVSRLHEWAAVIPVSAPRGHQLEILVHELIALLRPAAQPLYDITEHTDEDVTDRIAELVREATLEGAHDELPHSIAVTVEEITEREDGSLIDIYANIVVERDSQKGIIIGKGGARLREIGADARAEIESLMGRRVFLSLRVRVAKDWQRDPKHLGRMGF